MKNKFWKALRITCLVICTLVTTAVAIDWVQSHSRVDQKTPNASKQIPHGVYRVHIGSARHLYYSSRPGMLSIGYMHLKLHETHPEDNRWIDWSCIPLKSLEHKPIVFSIWNILAIQKQDRIYASHFESRSLYLRHWLACLLFGILPIIALIKGTIRRIVSASYYFDI